MADEEETTTTETEDTDTTENEDTETEDQDTDKEIEVKEDEFLDEEPTTTTTTEKEEKDTEDEDELDLGDRKGLTREEVRQMIAQERTSLERTIRKEAQVDQFLASEEGKQFKPYAKAIRANAGKTNLKVRALAYAIAGPNLIRMGAKIKQDADTESKKTEISTGGKGRGGNTDIDANKIKTMSKEDFAKMQEKVLTGQSVAK